MKSRGEEVTMTKHTSGPWTYKEGINSRTLCDPDGNFIMTENMHGDVTPTSTHDWALISAAPQLLETVKMLINAETLKNKKSMEVAKMYAQFVIAKAEGAYVEKE
jgi:hypothetical protein